MKTFILWGLVMLLGINDAIAQAKQKKKTGRQQTVTKKTPSRKADKNAKNANTATVVLQSMSHHQAYGPAAIRRLSIADPTVRALNERAGGGNVPISSSGIVGMPKRTYGFANGKILLRSTTATSSGTLYGSGAVGTGTTLSGVGTSEQVIGVNGKAPYAGPWLWGSRLPIYYLPQDSVIKRMNRRF